MMIDFIMKDYESHKLRLVLEVIGMLLGAGASVLLAATTPHPPMIYAYIMWLFSALLLSTCSWHRGSVGLTVLYLAYLVIDGIGCYRTLIGV